MAQKKEATRKQKTAEQRQTEAAEQKAKQEGASPLDNPAQPDQPDIGRHAVYFTALVGGGFLLNLLVLILVSGG